MSTPIARNLDQFAAWRATLADRLAELQAWLSENDLVDGGDAEQLLHLRDRLKAERLLVAVVAEVSRGKSELINAIFFGDTGRRVLPATPGRTTMCPVELSWSAGEPQQLRLLPIDTRLEATSLDDWKLRRQAWTTLPLPSNDPQRLAHAMAEVTRTHRVSLEMARTLGFWSDERPQDNPPRDADGQVEVPAWRHALVNFPHPLLQRGLVLLDTPGLNAIGAEPELTLSLLPSAHATLFLLAADTGVTRSDQAIWRDHLSAGGKERFVVLNKIDTLEDPLLSRDQVAAQVERQRLATSQALGVAPDRVFPISARQALNARIAGDARSLRASRLPLLEQALGEQLLPRQRDALTQRVLHTLAALNERAQSRLQGQRRQTAEQLLELNSLRGKSSAKVQMLLQRLDAESEDFERCAARLMALRSVHSRQVRACLEGLSPDRVAELTRPFTEAVQGSGLHLGARKALAQVVSAAHELMAQTRARMQETQGMLTASQQQLNTEFGFALAQAMPPGLSAADSDIDHIAQAHSHHLAPTQAWRLSAGRFMEHFQRTLQTRLRTVLGAAAVEVEQWARAATVQMDHQLRERRLSFLRRREALQRIQGAAGELEQRIKELQQQEQQHAEAVRQLEARLAEASELTLQAPAAGDDSPTEFGSTRFDSRRQDVA